MSLLPLSGRKGGFTLVELLLVITLITILSVLALTTYGKSQARSKLSRVTVELNALVNATNQYVQDNYYQYPPEVGAGLPNGIEKYLAGGTWPTSVWPKGIFDWDSWTTVGGQPVPQIYQMSYRLCGNSDDVSYCSDPYLFPHFTHGSAIYNCMQGDCVPDQNIPTVPGYCVNCQVKEVNPPL